MGSRMALHEAPGLPVDAAAIRLPWNREPGEYLRLALSLALFFLFFIPLAILIPRIDLPEPDRKTVEKVPPQLARLIQARPEVEKPAPVIPVKPLEPEPVPSEPVPTPQAVEPTESRPVEAPPKPVVRPEQKPAQSVKQAREVAAKSGLLALSDELSAMQSEAENTPSPRLTANVGKEAAIRPEPSQVAVPEKSKGIEDAKGPTEAVQLARHQVRQVEEPRPAEARKHAKVAPEQDTGPGKRSMANIRRVFDKQKAVLFSLYNRELRKNPALAGEVLLEVTIEPDGRVSNCRIVNSELEDSRLERKIAARVRLFNFGAADVEQRQVRFPIDFLPS